MTRFGPRIEPNTSSTPGECANCYATDAGDLDFEEKKNILNIFQIDKRYVGRGTHSILQLLNLTYPKFACEKGDV